MPPPPIAASRASAEASAVSRRARIERGVDQRLPQHEGVELVLVLQVALFLA
jgi:hypothetical protein